MIATRRTQRLLEVVDELATCRSESDLVSRAPRAILNLVGGDVAAFTRIDVRSRTAQLDLYPNVSRFTMPTRQTAETMGDNPVVCHWNSTSDLAPRRVSDLVGRREWRRSSTFANVLGPMGTPHLLGVPLYGSAAGGPSYAIARSARDFTDDEMGMVGGLQAALLALHRRFRSRPPTDAGSGVLTTRELQVLELLAMGLSGRQISTRLGLAAATVRKHLERVYSKLGVHDRMNAVFVGEDLGLIQKRT